MEMSTLYWLTRLDAISSAIAFPIAVFSTIWIVSWAIAAIVYPSEEDSREFFKIHFKKFFIAPVLVFMLVGINIFIPTNKDLAIILGGYYAINNEELQKMPTKAAKVVNKFMDDYLEKAND